MAHIAIDARVINSTTGRYVERLLHYLQDVDKINQYSVLVREKDFRFWKPTATNFSVVVADFDNYSFAEQIKFKKFLEQLAPDLVHFAMPQQPVWYKGKTITTFHDLILVKTYNSDKNWFSFHFKQAIGKKIFKKVAKKSDAIIAVSEFTKNDLVNFAHISPKKISVIYESGETTAGTSRPYELPFKKYILYVGQQSDYKNIKRLGDAHQVLLNELPELGLVLAGKKNNASKRNEAYFKKKEYKNILFTDFVEDDELNWLYENARLYAFPSLMEGFGLPGLEAMAHGAPVVCSDGTCLPEIYGDAAYYFNPNDTEDMVRSLSAVVKSEYLRNELRAKGYKQIKKYSWKKMAQQTHALYLDVLSKD